jgi:hypothetical protein
MAIRRDEVIEIGKSIREVNENSTILLGLLQTLT